MLSLLTYLRGSLFFGDIGGDLEKLVKKVAQLHQSKAGPFEAAFCTSDLLLSPSFLEGDSIQTMAPPPIPIYYFGIEYALPDNFVYLGRGGVTKIGALLVGFWKEGSVIPFIGNAAKDRGVDVLLADTWPLSAVKGLDSTTLTYSSALDIVASVMHPRYLIASGNTIAHEVKPSEMLDYRFVGLASFGLPISGQRGIYAASIKVKEYVAAINAEDLAQPSTTVTADDRIMVGQKRKFSQSERASESGPPKAGGPSCWFCINSPDIAEHMIVDKGRFFYLATAKGPLVPEQLLLIPIKHQPALCWQTLHSAAARELHAMLTSCASLFHHSMVMYERVFQWHRGVHTQLHLLPMTRDIAPSQGAESFLSHLQSSSDNDNTAWSGDMWKTGNENENGDGSSSFEAMPLQSVAERTLRATQSRDQAPFVWCAFVRDGDICWQVATAPIGSRPDMSLPRAAIAAALHLPPGPHASWRDCTSSRDEETAATDKARQNWQEACSKQHMM